MAAGIILTIGGVSSLGGCGGAPPQASATVRDSAGIRIVTNHGVEDAPLLELVPRLADSIAWGYEVGRLADVSCAPNGRVAVADNGPPQVVVTRIDSGGTLQRLGSLGSGPGEMRRLVSLRWLSPDSLVVQDGALARLSIFSLLDGKVRTISIGSLGASVILLGAVTAERFAFTGASFFRAGTRFTTGIIRPPVPIEILSLPSRVDTLVMVPDEASFILARENGFVVGSYPFGQRTVRAFTGRSVVVGTAERYELVEWTLDGSIRRIIRVDWSPRQPSAEEWKRAYAAVVGTATGANRELSEQLYKAMKGEKATIPPYQRLLVDSLGSWWVQKHRIAVSEPARWHVFDAAGRIRARVSVPAQVRLVCVMGSFGVGIVRDNEDVDHFVSVRIPRPY
jgi:hypothetical protein